MFQFFNRKCWYRVNIPSNRIRSSFFKRFLFASGSSIVIYTCLSIISLEKEKSKINELLRNTPSEWNFWTNTPVYRHKQGNDNHSDNDVIKRFKKFWKDIPEKWKTVGSLLILNTCFFAYWRINPSFMTRHFTFETLFWSSSQPSWTLLTSVFSHNSAGHFLLNMVGLCSLGIGLYDVLGREQFLFLYLTSGIWSNFASSCVHTFWLKGSMVTRSLGASGSLCALLGIIAHFHDAKLRLLFLPLFDIPAHLAVLALVSYDFYNLIASPPAYHRFDHAAHLSGVAFGYLYHLFGREYIWKQRKRYLNWIGYR